MDAIDKAFPETKFEDNHSNGEIGFGSTIFAVKPGDGSAREQAASCQKVLGGWANIANEYATKRYRSNLINWGMLPFIIRRANCRSRILTTYTSRISVKQSRTNSPRLQRM